MNCIGQCFQKIFSFFTRFFKTVKQQPIRGEPAHLEPKYWQEVIEFMEELKALVETHTIDDENIHYMNQRVIEYIEKQINVKGKMLDLQERYLALDTFLDQISVKYLSKLVGMKHTEMTKTEFIDCVEKLKKGLHQRRQKEMQH